MAGYGFVPQPVDPKYNLDGLPIGITKTVVTRWTLEGRSGLGCAACQQRTACLEKLAAVAFTWSLNCMGEPTSGRSDAPTASRLLSIITVALEGLSML